MSYDSKTIEELVEELNAQNPNRYSRLPGNPVKLPGIPVELPGIPIKLPGIPVELPGRPPSRPDRGPDISEMIETLQEEYGLSMFESFQLASSGGTSKKLKKNGEITIKIIRTGGIHATLGNFVVESKEFETRILGATLELKGGTYDLKTDYGVKTYPIPSGTYKGIGTEFKNKFSILLTGIDNFERVHLHRGNYPWDTDGCILLGEQQLSNVSVTKNTGILAKKPEKWKTFVNLDMITLDEDKDGNLLNYKGKTDMVISSVTTMSKIENLYNKVKKEYPQNTFFTVTVQ